MPLGGSREWRRGGGRSSTSFLEALGADPSNVVFSFEARAITYADGSTEKTLDDQ